MFTPLWRWMTGTVQTKTENLYDLTDEQIEQLRSLTKQPGWRVYLTAMDRHTAFLAEQLLIGEYDTLLETRGVIKGYREAAYLVANLLQAKDQRDARSKSERLAVEQSTERAKRLTRYTPFA